MSGEPANTGSDLGDKPSSALPILFFDASCLFCIRSIRWIIRHDPAAVFSFAGLESNTAAEEIPTEHPLREQDTVILLDEDGLHGRSEAVFRVLRRLKTSAKILLIFSVLPRFCTDWGYRLIAANRHRWFGRDESCPLPEPGSANRFLD